MSLHEAIAIAERHILAWHRSNEASRRLETIPGIGPITASALAASITDPEVFRSGRELAAWIGLVPRQASTVGQSPGAAASAGTAAPYLGPRPQTRDEGLCLFPVENPIPCRR